jgi:hypothetical protein
MGSSQPHACLHVCIGNDRLAKADGADGVPLRVDDRLGLEAGGLHEVIAASDGIPVHGVDT